MSYEQNPDGSFNALCKYCSDTFPVYDADLDVAYGSFVEDVEEEYGVSTFTDSGFPIFYPSDWEMYGDFLTYFDVGNLTSFDGGFSYLGYPKKTVSNYKKFGVRSYFSLPAGVYNLWIDTETIGRTGQTYCTLNTLKADGTVASSLNSKDYISKPGSLSFTLPDPTNLCFSVGAYLIISDLSSIREFEFTSHIECVSLFGLSEKTADSRPTSFTANYGIIGDDGSLTKIDATTIVNEGSSTYYNPITNTSHDLSGWVYDYSTRTYNLTTADDNSVTVTYGDENITINEGDVTYNVYYLVENPATDDDGSGSGGSGSGDGHTHDHTSEITTAASCLLPGVRTYTCSCGDTYTKSIPATGHAWAVSQQVNTTYDPDTGELLQQGYTVYVCNTCGDQYRDDAGTGPPNGSSGDSEGEGVWDKIGKLIGTIFDGILGLIEGVLGGILDGLISLATMISDKLTQVVDVVMSLFAEIPAMFTGFLDFLGAVFPFIPEEMMTLLTFGLAAVVFIGLLKWLWR